ncbi:hypothetical protein [Vibrio sp. LaRot3]|uniref:hypothetical protein n=1 Tax=Vibrio sp. LaRot3 TaxID=2998829 RepID=UPI0022CDD1DC|nr:hypothetical protein [Vibrio sp. LaRot3]MDA0150385.1 hypothetical protein [Vibrio sp. LaRot3]
MNLKLLFTASASVLLTGCFDVPPLESTHTRAEQAGLQSYYGQPVNPSSLEFHQLPQDNQYLSTLKNGLHFDNYNSDVSNYPGPIGRGKLELTSHKLSDMVSACPTVMFTAEGDIASVCLYGYREPPYTATYLHLFDKHTLAIKASLELPRKQNLGGGDASGGGYAHMDAQNRVVTANTDHTIRHIRLEKDPQGLYSWVEEEVVDLSGIFAVMPDYEPGASYLNDGVQDYQGRYWFTLGTGEVGYYDPSTNRTGYHDFGEQLQNQTAMDPTGVYVVTGGTAEQPDVGYMNKLVVEQDGTLKVAWSTPYDNSGKGVLAKTSGTTPTLFGRNDNYLTVADNGKDQLHVNIYNRTTGEEICSVAVFPKGRGGAEDSMIGYQDSVVIANTGNYVKGASPLQTFNGLAKVTVLTDDMSVPAEQRCVKDWEDTSVKHTAVPVLSTQTGLIYTYPIREGNKLEASDQYGTFHYYMAGVDWHSGQVQFQRYIGSGKQFDDYMQSVTLGESGEFIVTTTNGILVAKENLLLDRSEIVHPQQ